MDSPSKYDAERVKEFAIDAGIDLDDVLKLSFVRSQFDEIRKMLFRERVDLILAEEQAKLFAEKDKEEMVNEAKKKILSYRSNIEGYVRSLKTLKVLKDELDGQTDVVK